MSYLLRIAERIASSIMAGDTIQEAANAAYAIIDGIDGLISEQGEEEARRYWKQDILKRWDAMVGKKVIKEDMLVMLYDLIDGMEGFLSEQGEGNRYWKSNVLRNAKNAERRLKMV